MQPGTTEAPGFDAIAARYHALRPGYPDALVDEVLAFAGCAAAGRLLEIGCGTGQATRSFAGRGHAILCLEPGPRLARTAARALAGFPAVSVRCTRFEDWPLEPGAFDLVYAARSFHWLEPSERLPRSAAALRPGGALAVFSSSLEPADPGLADAFAACDGRAPEGPEVFLRALAGDVEASHTLGPPVLRAYPARLQASAHDYLRYSRTRHRYLRLPADERTRARAAWRAVLARCGEPIALDATTHLLLARRL
jgi:SAM-dependent methyltransferase